MINLIISGEPVAKARPRITKYGTYTPIKSTNYETFIKELFAIKYPDFKPIERAIYIVLRIYLSIPKSVSNKKRDLMLLGNILPTKKPDIDNVIKIVFDALEGLAYKNDNQIIRIVAEKYYSNKPRLEILLGEF